MAITVEEKPDSRESAQGDTKSATLTYIVRGTADDAAARTALAAEAPLEHDGLVRQTCAVDPVHIDSGNAAVCAWTGSVEYGQTSDASRETGDSIFSFDIGGGTQHVVTAAPGKSISACAPDGETAPPAHGIGDNGERCEGADIMVPVYHFSETHYLSDSVVTPAYKQTLFQCAAKTNLDAFRGFEVGEVLFLGASGSKRGKEDWEVTFRFAAKPNRENFTVAGGTITVPSCKGWHYLWLRFESKEDDDSHRMYRRAIAAYVAPVYEEFLFSSLGI